MYRTVLPDAEAFNVPADANTGPTISRKPLEAFVSVDPETVPVIPSEDAARTVPLVVMAVVPEMAILPSISRSDPILPILRDAETENIPVFDIVP